jgi:hypothetical protein
VKATLLKCIVSAFGLFAAFYIFFLCSMFVGLSALKGKSGEVPEIWALMGAGAIFAGPALFGSVALVFIGRLKGTLGVGFCRASRVLLAVLALAVFAHVVILVWRLRTRTTALSGRDPAEQICFASIAQWRLAPAADAECWTAA